MNIISKKIKETKYKKFKILNILCYYINNNKSDEQISKLLQINVQTVKKWRKEMNFIEKIQNVKIDRALAELIFSNKEQILCFEFLKKDYNYFLQYDVVSKHIKISRYFYKIVKNYIKEELTNNKQI